GQSATATFATEKAEAQRRQNAAISTGKGNRSACAAPAGDCRAGFAVRMSHVPFWVSVTHMGLRFVIEKLNDQINASGNPNGRHYARPRPPPQFCLRGRHRRFYPRRRARPSHSIDREPADPTSGAESRLSVATSKRSAGHTHRAG